jgi:hypothetical protein
MRPNTITAYIQYWLFYMNKPTRLIVARNLEGLKSSLLELNSGLIYSPVIISRDGPSADYIQVRTRAWAHNQSATEIQLNWTVKIPKRDQKTL